jgi:hypothetical protein
MASPASKQYRNSGLIGPCSATPPCLRMLPHEATPKHQTSEDRDIPAPIRNNRRGFARPEPHFVSCFHSHASRFLCGFSIYTIFNVLFLRFSLLCTVTCSFPQERACSFLPFNRHSLNFVFCLTVFGLWKLDAGRHCWRKASTSSPSKKRERASLQTYSNTAQDAAHYFWDLCHDGPPLRSVRWITVDLRLGYAVTNHTNAHNRQCCDGFTARYVSVDWYAELTRSGRTVLTPLQLRSRMPSSSSLRSLFPFPRW